MARKSKKRLKKSHEHKDRGVLVRRLLAGLLVVLLSGTCTWLGWKWIESVPVRAVVVDAPPHIPGDEIRTLAGVDTTQMLFALNPNELAARVQTHPWVRTAAIGRIPDGTLKISVTARSPVARLIDTSGRPGAYIDATGRILPDDVHAAFNVPLLRGAPMAPDRVDPEEHPLLVELLNALGTAGPSADALLSEILLNENRSVTAYLNPAAGQTTVRVALGKDDFENKLKRLAAFWHQVVVPRPGERIDEIDLRFDSQIVVRHL